MVEMVSVNFDVSIIIIFVIFIFFKVMYFCYGRWGW